MSFLGRLFDQNKRQPQGKSPETSSSLVSRQMDGYLHPPGTRIGQYEVVGQPMVGGMGIVYVCLDRRDQRPMALKTFKPEYLPDRAARDRFLREGTAWVRLGMHPHIVRCHEVFHPGNALEVYLVLDLVAKVQGRRDASLRSWLMPGKPLPMEQALSFGLQIARAMRHATAIIPGFVHRDLKPENTLVGADKVSGTNVNRLRVTDFGLVSALQRSDSPVTGGEVLSSTRNQYSDSNPGLGRARLTHGIVGTPLYMAPEQWQGESVGAQTDMYALGCILYEMVVGQHAVTGNNLGVLERAHCEGKMQLLPGSVPAVAGDVVRRCLALKREMRYDNWESVEAALAAAYMDVCGQAVWISEPAQATSERERVTVGRSYNALGTSYIDIGEARAALGYFERAVKIGRTEREGSLEADGLSNLGNACFRLGDYCRAIESQEQAYAIHCQISDRLGESQDLGNLGNSYLFLGDYPRAMEFYRQHLAIAREIGDRLGESQALGNLGVAYKNSGDYRRAIESHETRLAIAREIGDHQGEGQSLGNLGEAYRNLKDYHRALEFYQQHLAIAREVGDRHGEGTALGNMGIVYKNLGDYHYAIECYQRHLVIAHEIGDGAGAARTNFNLALLLTQCEQLAEAVSCAERAAQSYAQIGLIQQAQQAQQLVAQLRAKMH